MPWTEKLPSGKWRACWRDTNGAQRSRSGFDQKAGAMRFAGEQETDARAGRATYQGRSVTWGRWAVTWQQLRRVEASTLDSDTARITRWMDPRWGNVPLSRITQADVQRWVNDLSAEMAPASVAKVYRLLSSSLRAAVQAKELGVSPCVGIALPTVPPGGERFLTRSEVDAIAYHLGEPYRSAVIVLAGTGMRFGEMAGLHWHRVDEMASVIDVVETWDGDGIKAYPKGRRQRRVPAPSWVLEALPERGTGRTCELPHPRGSRCRSPLVFHGPGGAPLDHRNMLRRHWNDAVRRAGVEPCRQHDLRHSYASWLVQAGRSMAEIAAVLGHSETTVTARYAHLGGTHMDAVRNVLETAGPDSKTGALYLPHKAVTTVRGDASGPPGFTGVGDTGIEPVTPAV
jgi:integrase